MCAARAELPAASADLVATGPPWWRLLPSRVVTFCIVEVQRIRNDQIELITRAIQPALWLLIFGETFSRFRVIPTGNVPYLDYLAPGIMAQSALFIAIFFGIQIIWERDFGILTRLLSTPTPRAALISGKAFAAGVRAGAQSIIIFALSALLGVHLRWNPLYLVAALLVVIVSAAFFSTFSMTIAGLVLSRERLMGIGQAITMPLFFASNALYPVHLMPGWLQAISTVNPLSYEVDALRGLLLGTPSHLGLDVAVLAGSTVLGITVSSSLLRRLAG
ncbi:MAG: ABC transporter permease [Candidatus Dormibacteraeota bacterium]|nr:ABC transporter permease [Candidatus Dormibacteraeota bacterium]